ncbi:sugar transferase [Campylobacter geochelonis]|uniref:sugar transferase n=1 Tax=Campylobacter geochelonis TaxID=1780362 RepID=UPI0007709B5C|nr:sugar transferase [Campylobacter geochelonis]CZE49308.1 undecaprenyl-phosphate galactosephosphotransferase [Campylobacter geochelonis]CZE51419.1 undecaprenyl-phosphate galactosephosphotransferase [Campylobacter geochelonis]
MIRFFDFVFSFVALVCLLPLFFIVMIVLYFTGEGEIFYIQQRVGKNTKPFGLIKFATMLKNSPNLGTGTVTTKDDPRVLPFGKFLRKTKINELPQIFNIIKGDMSLIGPRPQDKRCFDVFLDEDKENIIKIRPGLSGMGAIFFRDEESILEKTKMDKIKFYDEIISPYKGKLESWYIKNYSLKNYFLLIGITVWVVLFPKSKIYTKIFRDLPIPPKELS